MRTFNMGAIYAIANVANPTPVPIASLKGFKGGVKQNKKGFRGPNRDIVDVGDGPRDWPIDIQSADFRASAFQLVAGGTTTSPGLLPAIAESATITAGTFTVANAANFVEDGGVLDLTAGLFLKRVASGAVTGQYSVAAGVYTCAVADNGHLCQVTYGYNATGAVGTKTTVSNSLQSQSTPFKLRVYDPWPVNGQIRLVGLDYYSVHFEEFDFDFKVEDFAASNLKGFASQDMIGTTLKVCDYWGSELG